MNKTIQYLFLAIFIFFVINAFSETTSSHSLSLGIPSAIPNNEKFDQKTDKKIIKSTEKNVNISSSKKNPDFYQLFTIIAGFMMIGAQIYFQQRNALKLQKENYRDKLKLDLYKKIEKSLNNFAKIGGNPFLILLRSALECLRINSQGVAYDIDSMPYRPNEFLDYNKSLSKGAIKFVSIMEKWEIANPKFKVFRLAINSISYDIRKIFSELAPILTRSLPVNIPNAEQVIWPTPPAGARLDQIIFLLTEYINLCGKLKCYIHDLQIESQNTFLGHLFKNKVALRKPLDSRYAPINFEEKSIEEWVHYFEYETEWGKTCRESDKNVLEELAKVKGI